MARAPSPAALRLGVIAFVAATGALACKSPPAWLAAQDAATTTTTTTSVPSTIAAEAGGSAGDGGHSGPRGTSLDAARKDARTHLAELITSSSAVAASTSATYATSGCDAALATLDADLGVAHAVVTVESKSAYVYFANCARHAQRWALLGHLGKLLFAFEPSGPHAAFLSRALVGFGQYDAAANLLVPFFKPGAHETEALVAAAIASGRVEDDEGSMRRADDALTQLRSRTGFAAADLVADARVVRAEALFRRGRLDEARSELDTIPPRDEGDVVTVAVARLRDACTRAKTSHVGILVDTLDDLFVGLYALASKPSAPLPPVATFKLYNFSGKALALHFEVAVPSVTQTAVRDIAFLGKKETIKLTPPLSPLFDARALTAPEDASLTVRVTEGAAKNVVLEETHPVHLAPRTSLPLLVHTAARGAEVRRTRELAVAWIAPKAKAIAAFVEAARTRAKLTELAGASGVSAPQVQALWDELTAEGFAFDQGPRLATEAAPIETVRSVADIAASKRGTPREGSLFFASALAAIGLEPLLADVPGDAYVGWLPTPADRASPSASSDFIPSPAGTAKFLEISAAGQRPFGTATLRANATTVEYAGEGAFTEDRATIINVVKASKLGIPLLGD